jgi:flagellar hook-length control protein FliK
MSTAAALPAITAPAAPATSQGSAAVDASAFEGLLSSMMGGDAAEGEGDAALPTEKTDTTDAALAGAVVPAQTLPPAPQPILLIIDAEPAAEAPASDAIDTAAPVAAPAAAAAADTETTPVPAQTTPAPIDKAPVGKTSDTPPQVRPAVKAEGGEAPQVQPAAPTETGAKAAPVEPQTQPPAPARYALDARGERITGLTASPAPRLNRADIEQILQVMAASDGGDGPGSVPLDSAPATPAPETLPPVQTGADKAVPRPQLQPSAPADAADAPASPAADDGETPVLTKAAVAPVPNTDGKAADARPQPEAPPLRALADRASRPTETNAAVDTAAPTSSAPTATGVAATAGAASPTLEAPVARAEAAAPAQVAADGKDPVSDAPVEAPGPDAAPSAQAAHAARESLAPAMSRAAVEATAQIAAQILKRLDGRSTRFEMSLTPDELGRVDIKLDIDSEGRLAARLAFDNPAAAADLKGRTDELRRQLEQQGFHVADDAFEFSQRDSGSSAFDRGQDARQDRGQSRAFAAASRLNAEADTVAQPPRWTALSLTPAGVDMKV